MKDRLETAHQNEDLFEACIQPWIDEAFTIIATTERKLAQMQELDMVGKECDPAQESLYIHM